MDRKVDVGDNTIECCDTSDAEISAICRIARSDEWLDDDARAGNALQNCLVGEFDGIVSSGGVLCTARTALDMAKAILSGAIRTN